MSRWILRAAIFFCGLAILSAAGFLLVSVDVAEKKVPLFLLWLSLSAFVAFAILLSIGTWRKWRKARLAVERPVAEDEPGVPSADEPGGRSVSS
jgi:membrane protein implicated in regulation of membrane protease activity